MVVKIRVFARLFIFMSCFAAELWADPSVGIGRDELVARYGDPLRSMTVGDREILTYDQGKVVLQNGRVVSCDFSEKKQEKTEVGHADSTSSEKVGGWLLDFDAAKKQAAAGNRKVLALFTGSTWCPACMRFDKVIAHDQRFLQFAQKKYVLVKIDFPNTGLPPGHKNMILSERYQVSGYPTLLAMKADGSGPSRIDVLAALNTPNGEVGTLLSQLDDGGAKSSTAPKGVGQIVMMAVIGLSFLIWWIKR